MLIVRIGAMGDVLHAMPAVAALRQRHPEWEIGWAIEPVWSPLLQTHTGEAAGSVEMPLVDRVHMVPTRAWKKRPLAAQTGAEVLRLRRELRGEQYDLCVDLQGAIRSSVIGRMAGAREFAGPREPREGPALWLYKKRIATRAAHVTEQGCEVLGGAIGERLAPVAAPLPVDAEAEAWCDEVLERLERERFALVAPSAGWGAKQWPAERYGAVARELAAGYGVLVNAASTDDPLARMVVEASGGWATSLPCTIAQLIALVRRAGVVIAGDTGPLHLAAALQRPVVAIFGPTDPARNGPYGTVSRVLRSASSLTDHSRHATAEQGMLEIGVDEVVAAALDLLRTEEGKVVR